MSHRLSAGASSASARFLEPLATAIRTLERSGGEAIDYALRLSGGAGLGVVIETAGTAAVNVLVAPAPAAAMVRI